MDRECILREECQSFFDSLPLSERRRLALFFEGIAGKPRFIEIHSQEAAAKYLAALKKTAKINP